jgi:type I restriction-modification system DNA methylase subunit
MKFFQNSVLQKHLKNQDAEFIKTAYKKFTAYFHNPEIQQNIRDAKEEQFQEGFLRELFVNVLGYTLNPSSGYNLTSELKNEKGAKKADGAILKDGKALAVIELKGTDTKDLDKINVQAFNYKNNQTGCIYVITSNFEKLRFFIHHSVDHLEFNLFTLSEDEFQLLWLCLSAGNLLTGVPLKVKEDSLLEEEKVTKQLYKDYSAFRTDLWQNMVKNSPEADRLLLFKKTQKLLDRYLFILFAEDSGLLPPNSVSRIIKRWEMLKDEDAYKPLYIIFNQYFGYINTGRKGKNPEGDIFAYNGGLFLPDEILDHVVIDDEILHPHVTKLTNYDFQSEIDVNILGHIFENSLNEIENITAELEGQVLDKSKTKRKKDGVFYTPKYITKYIVENTIGELCDEKKTEFEIVDEEYAKGRRNRKKETIKKLADHLQAYRNWLLQITICDPACGSGAFLNQALEFLMTEHAYIDELQAQLFGASIVFQDISNHILEQNIYGVDINEESVDIAKLSLWLRTAQRGRKLTTLNNNIKCGNSLIDDPAVAGDKAFNWQNEFPAVFEKGGFDVVIGNPPYVSSKEESFKDDIKRFLTTAYKTSIYQIDLYILFLEKSKQLHNQNGICSFIVPNAWLNNLFIEPVRRYLLSNSDFYDIVSMPTGTFIEAGVDTIIVSFGTKKRYSETNLLQCRNSQFFETGKVNQNQWLNNKGATINLFVNDVVGKILEKMKNASVPLESFTEIARGVGVYHKRVGHTKELIAEDPFQSKTKKDETFVPYLRGKNVCSWHIEWNNDSYLSYGKWIAEPREPKYFEGDRIVLRQIPSQRLIATFITDKFITDQSVFIACFKPDGDFKPEAVLALVTSKLMSFFFRYYYSEFDELFPKLKLQHFKDLPINLNIKSNCVTLIELASKRLKLAALFLDNCSNFNYLLMGKYEIEKLTTKLQNWHELEFKEFLNELKKAKVQLRISEEAEWMQYFKDQKQKALELKTAIDITDREIDSMVYALYGLNDEEIKIVEQA